MGNCCTRAYTIIIGWMMAGRTAAPPQISQQSTLRDPSRSVMHPRKDDFILLPNSPSPVQTTNNLTEKQEVTEELQDSPGGMSSIVSWLIPKNFTNNSRKLKLEGLLKEKTTLINELRSSQEAQNHNIRNLANALDRDRRINQEIREVSGKEVHQLKSIIEEKEKDLEAARFYTSQLQAKCLKLESQLALIEKNAAQESLTSGSYSDDHANPSMVEDACKTVDKATEALARFLHSNSVTKNLSLKSPELELFVRRISPAHPADFSRPIQVKHVWAHWICHQMFQGFEHVFFDADGGQLTSPLDSKKHALECFQLFQQSKQSTVLFSSDDLFQAFCSWKYTSVFPRLLVNHALIPPGTICDENGRFPGDGDFYALFMDVARAVWLLHQLAFSFDPPASILRMARRTPYDKQFHDSVIHVEDGPGVSSQVVSLMIRPAFRVRKSTIRSRVFCATALTTQRRPN